MLRPKSVIRIRPDKWAAICAYCPDKEKGDDWAATAGYEITHGICPDCLEKFKMDSLKGTELEIK